ncbi:MAG TPA: ABC transporter substrate-binding protein [Bacillota bacterium]|nr:ABC transporter substrate-binding protein [Bacillota bacterium]
MRKFVIGLLLLMLTGLIVLVPSFAGQEMKVGYFPNITHAQAVIGMSDGTFQQGLGSGVTLKKYIFNAGPSVIEAMMAGHLDLAYIGPNPAVNGYIRTRGKLLKIVAGAASGGASLVLRNDLKITSPRQLSGLKLASPQMGNTQDVALRYYLMSHGLKPVQQGGTVHVLPVPNPDQLNLLQRKEIDGAWTVEPWVSRLITEARGVIFVDERSLWDKGKFVTANIIVSQKFLKNHPVLVKKWLKVHVELTQRINEDPERYQKILNRELYRITGASLPERILKQAFSRFELTWDPAMRTLFVSADRAYRLGFLGKEKPDLKSIYDLTLLNQVLEEKNLPPVK